MKFLYTLIFSVLLIPLLTGQITTTFDSFDGNAGFLSIAAANDVIGQEDYIMDLSGTGNPTGTLAVLDTFVFVGGVDFPGGELSFSFFDNSGNFADGFTLALPQAGNFIWTITVGGGFTIPTEGIVQASIDPNSGVQGQWFLVEENLVTGFIGSSPGNPFGLGTSADGNPLVFTMRMDILGDPISEDTCPSLLAVDGDILMNDEIESDTYTAADTITSTGTVPSPNVVTFEAGEIIILQEGFEALNGSTFTARIQTCVSSFGGGQGEGIITAVSGERVDATPLTIEGRSSTVIVENEVDVFPNPFSEQTTVQVELAAESDLQVELYDLSGKRVSTIASQRNTAAGMHQFILNAAHLEGGMYLLMIQTDEGIQTRKLSLIK
ncbi:MAG: T9SS type A sorting domain-containing protein [Bacteroidota bacterium]